MYENRDFYSYSFRDHGVCTLIPPRDPETTMLAKLPLVTGNYVIRTFHLSEQLSLYNLFNIEIYYSKQADWVKMTEVSTDWKIIDIFSGLIC